MKKKHVPRQQIKAKPQQLKTVFYSSDSQLSRIILRAKRLKTIQKTLQSLLPEQACNYISVADINPQAIVLHIGHSAWATKLRYQTPLIKQALAYHYDLYVDKVIIRVRPPLPKHKKRRIQREISKRSRKHLSSAASHIQNKGISQALEKLAHYQNTDKR